MGLPLALYIQRNAWRRAQPGRSTTGPSVRAVPCRRSVMVNVDDDTDNSVVVTTSTLRGGLEGHLQCHVQCQGANKQGFTHAFVPTNPNATGKRFTATTRPCVVITEEFEKACKRRHGH